MAKSKAAKVAANKALAAAKKKKPFVKVYVDTAAALAKSAGWDLTAKFEANT